MEHSRSTFRLTDLTRRVLSAAQAAGVGVKIEIEPGKLTVTMDKDDGKRTCGRAETDDNEWNEVFGNDNGKD
jgi:hypothetical protein